VTDEKLRFDFSHSKALTPAEVAAVEASVQAVVDAALPVHSQPVSYGVRRRGT